MPLLNQVADFSQVSVMAGSANAAATAGACHNFSLMWISQMFQDSSDAGAQARMGFLTKFKREAMVTQMVFCNEWTRQSMEAADKLLIRLRGLSFVNDLIPYSGYSKAVLTDAINKTDSAGMVYSFWFNGSVAGAGGGAHTIAFFRKMKTARGSTGKADNTIWAFDPNFGECKMVEGDLPAWIDNMLGNYGPCIAQSLRGLQQA